MLFAVALFIVGAMVVSRSGRGPLLAMGGSWLVSLAPILLGLIQYQFFDQDSVALTAAIVGCIVFFMIGARLGASIPSRDTHALTPTLIREDYKRHRPTAIFCWVIGMLGGLFMFADFIESGGGAAASIADLRDIYVMKDSATVYGRIGSVMTWGCLYSYVFALVFRTNMRFRDFVFFIIPVVPFLSLGFLSAGRQTAFQVLIVTVLVQLINRLRMPRPRGRRGIRLKIANPIFLLAVAALTIGYMGFIAVARNDNAISDLKVEVLARLFHFQTSKTFEAASGLLGAGVQTTLIEGVVYCSSPIVLFERFLHMRLAGISFGAMDFPFIFRQLQPVTGLNVQGLYQLKVDTANSEGLIGVGWYTAVSNAIMDFGYIGAAIFIAVQGAASGFSWKRLRTGGDFDDVVIAILLLLAAIYVPLIPAFSDTNLFFLLLFCCLAKLRSAFSHSRRRASWSRPPSTTRIA